MKKASLMLALLFLVKRSDAQTWSENFNNGLPSNWLVVDNDGLTPEVDVSYVDKAWVTDIKLDANSQPVNGDSVLVSHRTIPVPLLQMTGLLHPRLR